MKEIRLQGCLEPGRLEAGCDEAGRGPLAGPVYAAAVILPPGFYHPLLNDSKQMTEKAREELRPIIEAEAVAWAVEAVQAEEIDQLNILWASVTGMQRAVLRLDPAPDFLLVDGNKFRPFGRYGPRPPSSRKPAGTNSCGSSPPSTRNTAGSATWAIPPPNTSKPSGGTATPPGTANPSMSRSWSRLCSNAE